jgi:hypothetical protein
VTRRSAAGAGASGRRAAPRAAVALGCLLLLCPVTPAGGPAVAAAPAAGGTSGEGVSAVVPPLSPKVTFDLSAVDAEGLTGPPDGRVAIAYEYCIPATEGAAAAVRRLDPTAQVQPGSPGRIGCRPGQWLVTGSTAQPDWRAVLVRLAALDYVARIDRAFFE